MSFIGTMICRKYKSPLYREYGSPDVLRLEDVDKPAIGEGDVLVRVHAASVSIVQHLLTVSILIFATSTCSKRAEDVSPSDAGGALPSDSASALPSDAGGALPSDTGGALPSDAGGALPSDTGSALPSDAGGAWPSDTGSATPSDAAAPSKRFVSLSENQRYFQYPNGLTFVPIGHNHNSQEGFSYLQDPQKVDSYFEYMHQHGENVVRILLDGAGDTLVETSVGEFSPQVIKAMDTVLEAAEKHQIYIIAALWFWLKDDDPVFKPVWDKHPYNMNFDSDKGVVEHPDDLLTDTKALEAAKNRLRFFVERWGASPNIFSWELFNEFDAMGTMETQNRYLQELGNYGKDLEMRLYGEHHLRSTSISNAGKYDSGSGMYTSSALDFTSYHTYDILGLVRPTPQTFPEYFDFCYKSAELARQKSSLRPVVGTEDPVIVTPITVILGAITPITAEQETDIFIGSSWAGFLGGAAGPPLKWGGDGPVTRYEYPSLTIGKYDAQRALSVVLSQLDWGNGAFAVANEDVIPDEGDSFVHFALSSGDQMLLWLHSNTPTLSRSEMTTSLTVKSLRDREYAITWYNVRDGEVLGSSSAHGPEFAVSTPTFRTFVAAVIN